MYNVKIWNYDLNNYLIYSINDFICENNNENDFVITSSVFIIQ